MKRREAIKNIGLATGFAISLPSFLSILQSCSKEKESIWTPRFLNKEEKIVLTNLVDIILPKTEKTPSASELKIPQFIDTFIFEVLDNENQKITRNGFKNIITLLKSSDDLPIHKISKEKYTNLLDKYLLVKDEIDKDREANPEAKSMTNSEFLAQLKWMTIEAYRKSEYIGKEVLVYDPVPTEYYCGDLQKLTKGKSYSL